MTFVTGSISHGQGHATVQTQMLVDRLGVVAKGKKLAAHLLEAAEDDVEFMRESSLTLTRETALSLKSTTRRKFFLVLIFIDHHLSAGP